MRDPEAFAVEQATLGRIWTLLGLTSDIPKDNDWFRCMLGGQSVFIQRFGDAIKGFENVCPHRFYPIRTSSKGSGFIRCSFHHWVYNKDGQAVGIPQCKKLYGVSPKELGARLRKVEIATCGMLIFGRFLDAEATTPGHTRDEGTPTPLPGPADPPEGIQQTSLQDYLGEAWSILETMCPDGIKPGLNCSEVKANWKLLSEIMLDDYHAFAVHPTTIGRHGCVDPDKLYFHRFDPHSAILNGGRPEDFSAMAAECRAQTYQPRTYRALNFFPGFLIVHHRALHAWYISIWKLIPQAHDRTLVKTWYYQAPFKKPKASAPASLLHRCIEPLLPRFVGRSLKGINSEDYEVCERLQRTAGFVVDEPILGREEQRIGWFRKAYCDVVGHTDDERTSQ